MTEEEKKIEEDAPAGAQGTKEPGAQGSGEKDAPFPPLNFSTFILSLSSSVLISLGVIENPVTKEIESEPETAKQTIDLIELLKEKTKGNLTEEESKLIDDVLHELKIQYCRVSGV